MAISLAGVSLGAVGGWLDWDFIDVTGAGAPLSKENVYVSQGQSDFGNCTMREEAIWDGYKLVGCKSVDTGAVRYLGEYQPTSQGNPCDSNEYYDKSDDSCGCERPGFRRQDPNNVNSPCIAVSSSTTKPSTGGGGYVAPKPSTTPTTPVDVPESSGISGMKMVAIGMALAAVVLVVAKKKGYLRNSYDY